MRRFSRGAVDVLILFIIAGVMAAAAMMTGGFPSSYDQLIPSPTPTNAQQQTTYVEPDVEVATTTEGSHASSSGELADLIVVDLKLTDEQGKERTFFDPGERIYPKVTYKNQGGQKAEAPSGFILSQIYDNKSGTADVGLESDVHIWMKDGLYGTGSVKTYEAYPQGINGQFFKEQRSFVRYQPGTFTARAFINFDHGALESDYSNNQKTLSYTITTKPTPTPPPRVTDDPNAQPSQSTCGGKYSFDNPLGANFGDPACTFTKDKLYNTLMQNDPDNADYWYYTVIPCEAPGYNPNEYYRCGGAGCTPDPNGAWGLFQMGRGLNGQYDHGDVNWPKQVSNATTYRRNIGWGGWRYWACAESRW